MVFIRFCEKLKQDYFEEFGYDRSVSTPPLTHAVIENKSLLGVASADQKNLVQPVAATQSDARRQCSTQDNPQLPTKVQTECEEIEDEDDEWLAESAQEKQQILLSFRSQESEAIRQTDASLVTLSQLQTILATHIQEQANTIEKIADDVHDTLDAMSAGYDSLKKAKENSDEFLKTAVWLLLILSFILLFLDWYN
jgi:DNA repair exonuclease SbcCD ATPase subunit